MLTATDLKGLEERAKACLDGKSRSYVDDAKVFAKVVIEHVELQRDLARARLAAAAADEASRQ